ncbi:MAG TPA: hypothetical protein VM528_07185 [Burkholderiaceae bacterium]|jgi:hypothetical protein|nr:hypothetical protein [Burkholderiaceae bacterium]
MSDGSGRTAYRAAAFLALVAACLLVWLSLGVGIIGQDGDRANAVYAVVVAIGIVGSLWARLRPYGMSRTLFAMALAQALIGLVAVILGLGHPYSPAAELIGLTATFVTLFTGAALLFRRAARLSMAQ